MHSLEALIFFISFISIYHVRTACTHGKNTSHFTLSVYQILNHSEKHVNGFTFPTLANVDDFPTRSVNIFIPLCSVQLGPGEIRSAPKKTI